MLDHYGRRRPPDHGDSGHDLEYRLITADGRERWIGHRCTRVTAPDGTDLGVRASNRDITDRKAAERGLRDRDAENALLLREQRTSSSSRSSACTPTSGSPAPASAWPLCDVRSPPARTFSFTLHSTTGGMTGSSSCA
jgi:hypothetical protein